LSRRPDEFFLFTLVGLVPVGRKMLGNGSIFDRTPGERKQREVMSTLSSSQENAQILLTKRRLFDTFLQKIQKIVLLGLKREKR